MDIHAALRTFCKDVPGAPQRQHGIEPVSSFQPNPQPMLSLSHLCTNRSRPGHVSHEQSPQVTPPRHSFSGPLFQRCHPGPSKAPPSSLRLSRTAQNSPGPAIGFLARMAHRLSPALPGGASPEAGPVPSASPCLRFFPGRTAGAERRHNRVRQVANGWTRPLFPVVSRSETTLFW